MALAGTVYGLILGLPEIRRRADARQETDRQLGQANESLRKEQEKQQLAGEEIRGLEGEIRELGGTIAGMDRARQHLEGEISRLSQSNQSRQEEIVQLQGAYERVVAKLREAQGATQQERPADGQPGPEKGKDEDQVPDNALISYYAPSGSAGGDADPLLAAGGPARLVRVRCFLARTEPAHGRQRQYPKIRLQPGPDQPDQAQQQRWIAERTIVILPADSPGIAGVPGAGRRGHHHARLRGQINDAFDEYAAQVIVNPAYDKMTDWWVIQDPGSLNAAAQTIGNAQAGLHQFLLGAPASSVCRTLGMPAPAANAAGGFIGVLPLPIDRPMRDATMFFQFTGIVVGLLTGIPALQIACTKSLCHDLLQRAVATGIQEIGHNPTPVAQPNAQAIRHPPESPSSPTDPDEPGSGFSIGGP